MRRLIINGYSASWSNEIRPDFGTSASYGNEVFWLEYDSFWENLVISLTFHPAKGDAITIVAPTNHIVQVPHEATAYPGRGKIVVEGHTTDRKVYSVDVVYNVLSHSDDNGINTTPPTPSQFDQFTAEFSQKIPPQGGTTNQVLIKKSNADYDMKWSSLKTINNISIIGEGNIEVGGGGGGEPAAYLKSAAVQGRKLTLTNKDNTTVEFNDTGSIVSGANDGTNWTSITIDGTTKAIPVGGGGGAVSSVNGKTGAVVLNATDVGALPSTTQYVSSVNGRTGDVVNLQEKLTAGANVSISGTTISAVDTNLATQITLGEQITTTTTVGGIPAGTTYAANTKISKIIEDLLGAQAPQTTKLYYSVGATVPDSVEGMTSVSAQAATLISSGYIWKNLNLTNQYAFLAIDKSLGVSCYEILQSGFALGFTTKDLGNQILYYPSEKATDTNMRLTYHFEEA